MGDQVGDPMAILKPPSDHHRRPLAGDFSMTLPNIRQHHHVEHPGLIFQVEEDHSHGGGRMLAMGHHSPDLGCHPVALLAQGLAHRHATFRR